MEEKDIQKHDRWVIALRNLVFFGIWNNKLFYTRAIHYITSIVKVSVCILCIFLLFNAGLHKGQILSL